MVKYFKDPFAVDGDRAAVPDDAPLDGSVSYEIGFGIDYELEQGVDPDALNIPRDQFNQIIYDMTLALQQYQQFGFPDFITSADNGGSPFSYSIGAVVRYSNVNYYSLENANTDTPPSSKWGVVSFASSSQLPGDTQETYDSTLPDGWLWLDGNTIGNAASGGTARANADTSNLFTVLWNSLPNSVLPIQDSAGVATTRGISAAADFSADKRLPVPDKRGRVAAGADNMGGVAANRLTVDGSGISGTTLGAAGGVETVGLTANQNGVHAHSGSTAQAGAHNHPASKIQKGANGVAVSGSPWPSSANVGTRPTDTTFWEYPALQISEDGTHTHGVTINNSGLGSAHQNTQPTIISYFRIKL